MMRVLLHKISAEVCPVSSQQGPAFNPSASGRIANLPDIRDAGSAGADGRFSRPNHGVCRCPPGKCDAMRKQNARGSKRKETLLDAQIVHPGGLLRTPCCVLDLSEGGARIEVTNASAVPDVFDLLIPLRGTLQQAHIAWRHTGQVGVSFQRGSIVPSPSLGESSGEILSRMLELEAENAALKARLLAMQQQIEGLNRKLEASRNGYNQLV
jgi:hypothetical protein